MTMPTAAAQRLIANAMSEEDLLTCCIDLAHALGYRVAHFRPARTAKGWRTAMTGDAGFPDLVLANGQRVIFAELKAEGKKPTRVQWNWLAALEVMKPVEVHVWLPSQWLSGEIERCLRR